MGITTNRVIDELNEEKIYVLTLTDKSTGEQVERVLDISRVDDFNLLMADMIEALNNGDNKLPF